MLSSQVECFEFLIFLLLLDCLFLNKRFEILSCLEIIRSTVDVNEFVHGKITTTYTDNYGIIFDLHKHPSSVVPVHTLRFPFEMHTTSLLYRKIIYDIRQLVINCIVLDRLISKHVFFSLPLFNLEVQALDLTIS